MQGVPFPAVACIGKGEKCTQLIKGQDILIS